MLGRVRIALSRPLTFFVMAIAILILGVLAALRMPVGIFPNIRVRLIAVAWSDTGVPSEEMAGRIITLYGRVLTTGVGDIEHLDRRSPSRTSTGTSIRASRFTRPSSRAAGVTTSDAVIDNPPDSLETGDPVLAASGGEPKANPAP